MDNSEYYFTDEQDKRNSLHAEKTNGEDLVTNLLVQELTKLDLTECAAHEYTTMTDERVTPFNPTGATEERYREAVRKEHNIKQCKERVDREIESIEAALQLWNNPVTMDTYKGTRSESRRAAGISRLQTTKIKDNDAVEIIERVEKDVVALAIPLNRFNRKHKPLPSINPSEYNKH